MSHFATVETQVRDIGALRSACTEMGLTLTENAVARGYGANKIKGDFVIRLKGPYDIAVNKQPDGNYGLTTDWYAGHVETEVGKDYGRLLQRYAVCKIQIEVRKKGLTFRRQTLGDGSVKITLGGL